jgi:hypothetical protein
LDVSNNPISETITLNGVTNVNTVATFGWVQNTTCVTTGTGLVNAGTITSTLGTLTNVIEVGLTPSLLNPSQSRNAVYRVPSIGTWALLKSVFYSMGRENGAANLLGTYFYVRSQASTSAPILTHQEFVLDFDSMSSYQYLPLGSYYFTPGTVVWIEVISNAAVTTTTAYAEMTFVLTTQSP